MKVFKIKRLTWGYRVASHSFTQNLFERLTGQKWEHGYRTFKLVMVPPRTKRGGSRG